MKLIITLLFLVFQTTFGFSQKMDLTKSILSIPDSLKKNANVVTRYYHSNVKINSIKSMTTTNKVLITVLNEYGNKTFFNERYDNDTSVDNIKIIVYDGLGKVLKKVKNKEIQDVSLSSGLFSDDRAKYYKHIAKNYPYTIEINYTIKTSNTAFIRGWYAYSSFHQSIQEEKFTISYPNDLVLNLKEYNFDPSIQINKEEGKISYSVFNLKAIKKEPYMPSFSDIVPNVSFALNEFSLAGERGNASSWKAFGSWMHNKLLKDRGEIPEVTKNDVLALVKGIEDPIERARLVYEYMQNKTRYISIQIGIGGWKPMLSKDVDKLGYGDCKALSYYTKSLLDVAKVKSAYTIVYSGEKRNIKKNLVSTQGNHAILMLPTKKDTIWLECTSQKLPFGQTGDTDDRDVLIINEDNNGKIVHTNKYSAEYNYQKIISNTNIDKNGSLKAIVQINSFGKQYNNRYWIIDKDKKQQIDFYKNKFSDLIDVQIDSIEYVNDKRNIIFKETLNLSVPQYSEIIGNDMVLKLNAFNNHNKLPKRVRDRKYPLRLKSGFLDEDEISIQIPEDYKISILPNDIVLHTKFGKYQSSVKKINETELLYKRLFTINEAEFSKEKYKSFRNFIKQVIKYDNQKIILSK